METPKQAEDQREDHGELAALELQQRFSTPIFQYRATELRSSNARLARWILELSGRAPGVTVSNLGGWHSEGNAFSPRAEPLQPLTRVIRRVATQAFEALGVATAGSELRLRGWCNVHRRGSFHRPHCHPDAVLSGVYYVCVDPRIAASDHEGQLCFLDPRGPIDYWRGVGTVPGLTPRVRVRPAESLMVLFPGWLQHYTTPHAVEVPRVTVAFNLWLERVACEEGRPGTPLVP